MKHETGDPFLFSSALKNPNRLFDGYCFKDRDYIWGHEGAEKYEKATGTWVSGSEDGCYASIKREDDGFLVQSDFWGYKKIYFYHSAEIWAFSNSLLIFFEHLRENGILLSPNKPVLESILLRKIAFEQVFSFDLIARGLQLLPSGHELQIGKSGARVKRVFRRQSTGTYRDVLSTALETWIGRIETLLIAGSILPVSALTGGLDSRAVFAILHRARIRAGLGESAFKLNCHSIKGDTTDLQVATDICQRMNLSLNLPQERNAAVLAGDEAVDVYTTYCLGVYHPIYFPGHSAHPLDVSFGGGGGENYRPFYTVKIPRLRLKFWKPHDPWTLFVTRISKGFSSSSTTLSVESMLHAGMEKLKEIAPDQQDLLMLHYQHFRNRFHVGRGKQTQVEFDPLGSSLMDDVARCAGQDRLQRGQLNYDIMYSLVPSLLGIPFDKAWKTPSSDVIANLTRAEIGLAADPGRVFISDVPLASARIDASSKFEALLGRLHKALDSDLPRELLGPDVIADAASSVQKAIASGRFFHATSGVTTAAVLAAGMFR